MNIVFYSNCQCKGIKYFLEKYLTDKNITVNFIEMQNNYQMIRNNIPLPIDILQIADIFIYQPIEKKWNIYSTDENIPNNIMSYLKKDCIKISFPYIYNSSLWCIITPSLGDGVTGGGYFKDVNKYINKECIEELKLNRFSLEQVIDMYNNGEINFNYEKRLINNLMILKDKEKKCNIIVSDFIEENIKHIELFLNQGHPTTPLFVHCANQIIDILYGEKNIFPYDYPEQYFASDFRLPHSKYDNQYWNFKYNVIINDDVYIDHIKNIYNSYDYELDSLAKFYGLDKRVYLDQNNNYVWGHNYINNYITLFDSYDKNNIKNILEIGLGFNLDNSDTAFSTKNNYKSGNSLRMWNDYFTDANIYGIDIRSELLFNENRIKTFLADQGNDNDLQNFINNINCKLDIIIDDGNHCKEHQVFSFIFLHKYLNKDGLYIIESVQPDNINEFINLTIFPENFRNIIQEYFIIKYFDGRNGRKKDDFMISFQLK